MKHFGEALKQKLISLGLVGHLSFEGCSADEIQELMKAQNTKYLPQVYIEFLETMGKKHGNFLFGLRTYPAIKSIKDRAKSIIDRFNEDSSKTFQLPDDAFVFIESDGFAFCYFHTDSQEIDPPVFCFLDEPEIERPQYKSLSDFFDNSIKEHLLLLNRKYPKDNKD
jgi:hypothetical protein